MLTTLWNAKPKTQKARGLRGVILGQNNCHLSGYSYSTILWVRSNTSFIGYNDTTLVSTLTTEFTYAPGVTWIARPCPVTPRHGFVESRIVKTVKDLRTVCEETTLADPRGEVLLMPFVENRDYSAVLTDQGLSIGTGHNGATTGKDAVLVPCISNIAQWFDRILGDLHISSSNGHTRIARSRYIGYTQSPARQPYLELVGNTIVQARYGPLPTLGATAYHPQGKSWAIFELVWEPSTALLADFALFETTLKEKIEEAKNNKGGGNRLLCLYLPHGTLSCHAAVQGICYGASVVTGKVRPQEGKSFIFSSIDRMKYQFAYFQSEMQKGLSTGRTTGLTIPSIRASTVAWAAAVVQGMAGVPLTPQSAKFLSTAVTILLRVGLMACFGEHRHFKSYETFYDTQTPIGPLTPSMKSPWKLKQVKSNRSLYYASTSRSSVLSEKTLHTLLGKVLAIESDFDECQWQSMMGGKAWGICTRSVKQLLIAYMRLVFRPDPPVYADEVKGGGYMMNELRAAIAAANYLLTVSHNNGKCLTKFVAKSTLDGITLAPGLYLMHSLTHEVLNESLIPVPTKTTGTDETVS